MYEIGLELNELTTKDDTISSFFPQIAYYAKTKWLGLPYMNYSNFILTLNKYDVDFVVVSNTKHVIYPNLIDSFEKNIDLELSLIKKHKNYAIYRVLK